jgi:energy-coupling factor transport system ATP-binding protein
VAFGPENIGVPQPEIVERVNWALSAVKMQDFAKRTPTKMSGGQKQRIAIAGVLALKPKVIVLDESTAMLDPQGRKEVLEVIKKLNKEQNTTVIAVTHYMDEIVDADRVIVLYNGEIACAGEPSEVFNQKENLNKWGLELPLSTQIALKLKEKGINLNTQILTKEGLVEELCALK